MIETIRQQIIDDPDNLKFKQLGYEPLFVLNKKAKILIIGQAPGIKAQTEMIAFKDKSGERLMEWLGVSEEQFRDPKNFGILPMDFYYPGQGKTGDLPPRKEFAKKWHPLLINELNDLKLIILAGSYAQNYYLKESKKKNLTETVKSFKDYLPDYFVLIHPSPLNNRWMSKNPWFEKEVLPELKHRVKKILKI